MSNKEPIIIADEDDNCRAISMKRSMAGNDTKQLWTIIGSDGMGRHTFIVPKQRNQKYSVVQKHGRKPQTKPFVKCSKPARKLVSFTLKTKTQSSKLCVGVLHVPGVVYQPPRQMQPKRETHCASSVASDAAHTIPGRIKDPFGCPLRNQGNCRLTGWHGKRRSRPLCLCGKCDLDDVFFPSIHRSRLHRSRIPPDIE